jgi:hypothetical protein
MQNAQGICSRRGLLAFALLVIFCRSTTQVMGQTVSVAGTYVRQDNPRYYFVLNSDGSCVKFEPNGGFACSFAVR